MSDDVLLDHAAQLIADARVACLKLAVPPEEIAKIMMDEAILALMAERLSLSDIQAKFKKYTNSLLKKVFRGGPRATLIQEPSPIRTIDSKYSHS
jgi:chorismate mutase